jgi:WD40 repeat protein
MYTVREGTEDFKCVAFSPDSSQLASAGEDNTVRLWGARSGQLLCTLVGHTSGVEALAFSPDGKRLASGTFRYRALNAVTYSPELKLWDLKTRQAVLEFSLQENIGSLAFTPDGQRLMAPAGRTGVIKIWDVRTGKEDTCFGPAIPAIEQLALSPDGKRIATPGANGAVYIWDAATGQRLLILAAHAEAVRSLTFSSDGRRLATASTDGMVKIWDGSDLVETSH